MIDDKGWSHYLNKGIYFVLIVTGIMISPVILSKGNFSINTDIGLMAYWNFNEGNGDILHDRSENKNHGTIYGATWTTGKYGNALSFDGINDYVSVPESTSLNIGGAGKSFSILAWTKKITGTEDFDYILFQGAFTTNKGLQVGWRDTDNFAFAFWDDDLNTPIAYPDESDWHLWAMTYDGETNSRKIYRDTVLVASDIAKEDYIGSGTLNIGKFYNYFFHGALDEIQIYNRTLSTDEVTQYYRGEVSLTPPPDTTTIPPVNTAPSVLVIQPNGGEGVQDVYEVKWSANDPDGDTLIFTISYSSNGGQTWTQLASGITDTSYKWNTTNYQAGSEYLVKIEANDGVLTAEDISDTPFTVVTVVTETLGELNISGSFILGFCMSMAIAAVVAILGRSRLRNKT